MEGKNEIEKSSFRIVDLLQRKEHQDNDKPMELTRKATQSPSSSSTSSRSSSQEHSPKNSGLRHGHNRGGGGGSGHNHTSARFGSKSQNNFQFLSSSRPSCNVPSCSSPESPEICNGREGNNETPPEVRPMMNLHHPAMYPYHHAHFPNLGSTFPRLFGTEAHMLSNMPLSVETIGQHRHNPSSFMTTSPTTTLNGTNPFFHNHQLRTSQQFPPDFPLWNGNGPHVGSGIPNSMITSYTDPRLYEYADNYPASSLLTRLASDYMGGRGLHPLLIGESKRKGGQIRFSNSQTSQLEKAFVEHKYQNAHERRKLAHSLALTDRQVKTWFQNRRAKWRKNGHKDDDTIDKKVHHPGGYSDTLRLALLDRSSSSTSEDKSLTCHD